MLVGERDKRLARDLGDHEYAFRLDARCFYCPGIFAFIISVTAPQMLALGT